MYSIVVVSSLPVRKAILSPFLVFIILILSIINILIVLASKIYNKIKDGKLTSEEIHEITEDIKQSIEEINSVKKGVK